MVHIFHTPEETHRSSQSIKIILTPMLLCYWYYCIIMHVWPLAFRGYIEFFWYVQSTVFITFWSKAPSNW